MALHKILQRQFARLELSSDRLPNNLAQWQEFVEKVNKVYSDNDEERYLIERSMELSSREIKELNERIQNAQIIARIGYWHYDVVNDVLSLSNELRQMLNYDINDTTINFKEMRSLIQTNTRHTLEKIIDDTIKHGSKFEAEIQIHPKNVDEYMWLYLVGAPYHCNTAPYNQLAGICMDITKRKKSEEEIRNLQQEIVDTARKVGMADVASSILHNVGNVLNSANVSVTLLNEYAERSHFQRFIEICNLIKEHTQDINKFLSEDEKGKLVPLYLVKLSEALTKSYNEQAAELANLTAQIQHIREIVSAQQSISRTTETAETVNLQEAMDSALKMVGTQLTERGIIVTSNYEDVPNIEAPRSKLIQILVNFIQNSKDALIYDPDKAKEKHVALSIKNATADNPNIELSVKDNGVGISKENLDKIFNYGFTTKKTGHGIGMHSSILAAKEIGGVIKAESEGEGMGAKFTLCIPYGEEIGMKNYGSN